MVPLRLVSNDNVHSGPICIGTTAGQLSRVDDAACIVVGPDPTGHQEVPYGGHWFETWCNRGIVTRPGWKPLLLMD
jgi:hypothetical protein